MKRIIILIFCFSITLFLFGKIWRINSNRNFNADFSSLQEAINSNLVNDFDTLYVENGSILGSITLNKPLVIIGPGYFLDQKDSTYAFPVDAKISELFIEPQAKGAVLMSLRITGNTIINADDITIERCLFEGQVSHNSISNLIFRNNLLFSNFVSEDDATLTNASIYNNIFHNGFIFLKNDNQSLEIFNNTLRLNASTDNYLLTARNANVYNNLLYREPSYGFANFCINFNSEYNSNSNFIYNAMNQNSEGLFPLNQYSVDFSNVFQNYGSIDETYKLNENSFLKTSGLNGDEIGAYGGFRPYVVCGLPRMPRIYQANIPSVVKDGLLRIQFKAKTQND